MSVCQGRADVALRRFEPCPDALPGAITQGAAEGANRGLEGAGDRHLEEVPQPACRHLPPPDLVGEPDADGPATTTASLALAAIDPVRTEHDSSALIKTLQSAMPNQVANHLAMGAGSQLEFADNFDPFRVVAVKPTCCSHVPTQKSRILPAQKRGGV